MMSNYILPFAFSLFDTATILCAIWGVYSLSIKEFKWEFIGSLIGLTVLSTGLALLKLHSYSLAILIPSLILTIIFVFKEKSMYALWVSGASVAFFLTLQMSLIGIFAINGAIKGIDIQPFTRMGYIIQTLTFIIALALMIYHRRRGFYFMFSFNNKLSKKQLPSQRKYVISSTIIIIGIILYYPKFYNSPFDSTFYAVFAGMLFSTASLIFLSIKRELEEA